MIADTPYYIASLIRVFCASTFLIVVMPLIMWHNYLKNKSYGYRFVFCVVTQNCFLINLVLLLGFLKICNRITVSIGILAFFFVIFWNFSDKQFFRKNAERLKVLVKIANGERKFSTVFWNVRQSLLNTTKKCLEWPLWKHIYRHLFEYFVLISAVIYNVWFLTYNVIRYHCYQFSDIPVHQAWIYQLSQGKLFGGGIYPFGMHSIVYLINNLFFLDLREVLLYFGAFQTVLLLIGVYLLSREIFKWKYSSIIVIISFSLLLNQGRYAASLPEECGMFAVALAAYCLLRFLRTPLKKHVVEEDSRVKRFFRINQYFSRRYMKTDILLFMLCVALTIEYHFYTAIVAFLLVLSIFLAHIGKMVKKQYWVPIFVAGTLGVIIAVTPLMACYAEGTPFEGSMQWALSVMNGEKWAGSDSNYQQKLETSLGVNAQNAAEENEISTTPEKQPEMSLPQKVMFYYKTLVNFSNVVLFGDALTKILFICLAIGIGGAAVQLLFRKTRPIGMGYISIIIYIFVIFTFGVADSLKIPQLIASARASSFAEPFLGIAYAMPVDLLFGVLSLYNKKIYQTVLSCLSIALCCSIVVVIYHQGWVHKFFDVNLSYYNEPEYITRNIRETYGKDTFTVVSTNDERYEVIDNGYHTNISEFMNMVNGNEKEFKIPTKYVFFLIEKRVLSDYYYGNVNVSPELASKKFIYYASNQDYYFQRAVLESQAYYWAMAFMKEYPNSFKVYFEDDVYIAFVLEQNPYNLYNFQINYLS